MIGHLHHLASRGRRFLVRPADAPAVQARIRREAKQLRSDARRRPEKPPLTHRAAAVLEVLTDEPQTARQIAPEVELTAAQTNTAVLQLSARELAMRSGGGWVRA